MESGRTAGSALLVVKCQVSASAGERNNREAVNGSSQAKPD